MASRMLAGETQLRPHQGHDQLNNAAIIKDLGRAACMTGGARAWLGPCGVRGLRVLG